ncbi:MAG: hypothetical protein P8Z42_13595 [Anaerolineales bacterium]
MKFADLETAVLQLLGNPPVSVDNLKDVQLFHRSLMQREAARLERKLGSDHPRVLRLKTRAETSLKRAAATAVELELARIQAPHVAAGDGLIHGRVVKVDQHGLGSLTIRLEDKSGRQIKDLGETQTDSRGYYAIRVDPQITAKLQKSGKTEVYLAVRDSKGKLIQRDQQPIRLEAGVRAYQEIRLEIAGGRLKAGRATTSGFSTDTGKKTTTTKKKSPKTKDEPWIVKGRVTGADGKPASGLIVRLYDKDRRYDDLLGVVTTDDAGNYEITYRTQDFKEGLEPGADLYLTVEDIDGNELYSSESAVRFNAGKQETIDVQLGNR